MLQRAGHGEQEGISTSRVLAPKSGGVAKSRTRLNDFTFTFSLSCIGEGNGNSLQCSCLENPRDRGAWWADVYGVAQSRTQLKRLSSKQQQIHMQKESFVHFQ